MCFSYRCNRSPRVRGIAQRVKFWGGQRQPAASTAGMDHDPPAFCLQRPDQGAEAVPVVCVASNGVEQDDHGTRGGRAWGGVG